MAKDYPDEYEDWEGEDYIDKVYDFHLVTGVRR